MSTPEIINILAIVISLMIAIIGHEIMHGRVAFYYKDDTAKELGRLSVNPIVHIDILGTIIVPAMLYLSHAGFLFGWAKPVPINMKKVIQNGGYNGAIAVSLAGVIYNFLVAFISYLLLKVAPTPTDLTTLFIKSLLTYSLIYNIVLGIFNLFPIPPLDGSRVFSFILRKLNLHTFANKFDSAGKYGMIILIILIASPLSKYVFAPIGYILKAII